MRVFGIVLIIVGILMMVFTGINFQKKENVAKIGPVEINKKENKHVGWPTYVGGIVAVAGVVMAVAGGKKK
ncbi:MAG: hypothetical protein BGO69_11400 [Bacteroidetes bacterium 46-16]|nr:MAG: hypothetical protein BGO69_11400 [Bacteroidetes bacterium 46-16]